MKRLVISTMGTSLLTNPATQDEREMLTRHANQLNDDCPDEVQQLVGARADHARRLLATGDVEAIRKASAELNGIYGLYDGELPRNRQNVHYLIATHTLQGETTAELLRTFLENAGHTAQIYIPPQLTTRSAEEFDEGIKNLLKWCDETLPGYRDSGYEIVFNLTGAFKSLQGYLNTIGMFYASRIVYIFEGGGLIEIPRLPIRIDSDLFRRHAATMLQLAAGRALPVADAAGLLEAVVDVIDGKAILSPWGELVWNQIKSELLQDPVELPRLAYTDLFVRDWKKISTDQERIKLQETLAKVSKILVEENGNTQRLKADGGVQYEDFANRRLDGAPIGHFRITQERRVSCIAREAGLQLRHYGAHDYVQGSP